MFEGIVGLLSLIGKAAEKVIDLAKTSPKLTYSLLAVVVAAAFAYGGYVVGDNHGSRETWDPAAAAHAPGPSASASAKKTKEIGGLDLNQYCRSYGYELNSEVSCSSPINLNEACDWDHGSHGLKILFSSSDPKSGNCVTAQNKLMGGIVNMNGFCQQKFETSVNVTAAVKPSVADPKKSWVCTTKIDQELACTWQYQKREVDARKESGLWACYQ